MEIMATVAECATHCFVSVTRLRDLIGGGQITHRRNGQYDIATVRREYIEYLQKAAQGRSGDAVGLSKQRVKLEAARTDAIEFKNAVARGDYVSLDLVEKKLTPLFQNFREQALSMPGKTADSVASACGGDRALVFRILDDEIREMLTELASGKGNAVSELRPERRAAVDDIKEGIPA
jgi:hypothetical protein